VHKGGLHHCINVRFVGGEGCVEVAV